MGASSNPMVRDGMRADSLGRRAARDRARFVDALRARSSEYTATAKTATSSGWRSDFRREARLGALLGGHGSHVLPGQVPGMVQVPARRLGDSSRWTT